MTRESIGLFLETLKRLDPTFNPEDIVYRDTDEFGIALFSHPAFVEAMREGFRGTLEMYMPKSGYSAPQNPRILSVGCGPFFEAPVLLDYFGIDSHSSDNVVGIEIKEAEVEVARRIRPQGKSNYRVVRGDAREPEKYGVGRDFDMIIARNPNVDTAMSNWYEIFNKVRKMVRPAGLVIVTAPNQREHFMLEEMMCEVGFKITLTDVNPYALRMGDLDWLAMDRGVILARP